MSDNIIEAALSIPEEKLQEIESINFEGVETDRDSNEIFGERLSSTAFQIKGAIELYKSTICEHKLNKHLLTIKGAIIFLAILIFLNLVLSAILSSNPLNPPSSEKLLSDISLFILIILGGGYIYFLKKKKKILLFSVFQQTANLINFFTPKNRFDFIQYVLQNKSDFQHSDDKAYFIKKIKELKALDKNDDSIGFSLVSLYLHGTDVVKFYQEVSAENDINFSSNKEILSLMNYFKNKLKEQAQTASEINSKE